MTGNTRPSVPPLAQRPCSGAVNPSVVPMLGFGTVRHKRLHPRVHTFSYATYFLRLPLRSMARFGSPAAGSALAWNRSGALSFHDCDHGDGRAPAAGGALGWLDETLQREGIFDATGEIWLQCYPRVLGFTFKPVSFWYCHRASDDQDGALRAIVVEVNNTFGERHCYLLDRPAFGPVLQARKVFHVSPFLPPTGDYQFRFMHRRRDGLERTLARVDYTDAGVPVLQTSVSGCLEPVTPRAIRHALWRYPFMTLGVVFHIHWQALRLCLKGIAYHGKPAAPAQRMTR